MKFRGLVVNPGSRHDGKVCEADTPNLRVTYRTYLSLDAIRDPSGITSSEWRSIARGQSFWNWASGFLKVGPESRSWTL
jgi:hypothetical protein